MTGQKLDEKNGPFDEDVVLCGVCGEKRATHQVSIDVQKGFDYERHHRLYHVDYSVCGDCARDVVEVKLGATLPKARGRRGV